MILILLVQEWQFCWNLKYEDYGDWNTRNWTQETMKENPCTRQNDLDGQVTKLSKGTIQQRVSWLLTLSLTCFKTLSTPSHGSTRLNRQEVPQSRERSVCLETKQTTLSFYTIPLHMGRNLSVSIQIHTCTEMGPFSLITERERDRDRERERRNRNK